ncbi:MAG TPA: DNA replication/repair protein RecF [Kofleriaceae bacterium]
MKISLLTAQGIRNLAPVELAPRERFNVFVGQNGQGKTNLLEAIYVVATLRSFRTSRLADMIHFDAETAQLGARVEKDGLSRIYQVELGGAQRRVLLDGKAVRPIARYFGGFNVVVFTPEDLALPRGSPGDRRKFLDRAVFNQGADYLVASQDYEKVLKQRNTVLKQAANGMARGQVEALLEVYDAQLAPLAATIANTRAAFVEKIRADHVVAFEAIGRSPHRAGVRYVSKTAGVPVEQILAHLRETHARDLATETTQSGPHRDDLAFELGDPDGNWRDAGDFASQGQLRAIMLAWKTAELSLLARTHGELPILLLDDVSSELDPSRNAYLFQHLATLAGQCFITTTSEHHVLLSQDRADYRIENGQISS